MKCEGKNCDNESIGEYRVWDRICASQDWGYFKYCSECIESDRSRGFEVEKVGKD